MGNGDSKDPPDHKPGPSSADGGAVGSHELLVAEVLDKQHQALELQESLQHFRAKAPPRRPFTEEQLGLKSFTELSDIKEWWEGDIEELQKAHEAASLATSTMRRVGTRAISPSTFGARGLLDDPYLLLTEEHDYGLQWNRTWAKESQGPPDEDTRRRRREGTKRKVAEELGLRAFGDSAYDYDDRRSRFQALGVHAFLDDTREAYRGNAPAGRKYRLGRFDVVVAKAVADLDRRWDFIKGPRAEFSVAHAAGLNVGESRHATDFHDFCCEGNFNAPGGLDEERYYAAMEHIVANIAHAAATLRTEHLVFFPFGMGAFVRHLGLLDPKFQAPLEMQRFRRRLARSMLTAIARLAGPSVRVHLCLSFGEGETLCNADAFLRALCEAADGGLRGLRERVTIHQEGDSLQTAADLAARCRNVMLVNGASRVLLGNHWFTGGAKRAMDENLHRRSWRMAATSYLLNGYGAPNPSDLRSHVEWLGGQVHDVRLPV